MVEDNVGGIGYKVRVSGDVDQFLRNMDAAQKKMDSLASRVDDLEKKVAGSFKQIESASKSGSSGITKGMEDIQKSITPSIGRLEDLTAMYRRVREASSDIDQSGDSFEKAGRAMQAYKTQMESGFESTQQMNESTSRLKAELSEIERDLKKQEAAYVAMEKSVGNAERQVATLVSRLQQFDDSEEPINELTEALERYRNNMENAAGDSRLTTQANEEFKNSMHQVKLQAEESGKSIGGLGAQQQEMIKSLQNTSKAIVLALGPLSEYAARVTAFTSLVRTNTFAIATFTATIVSMGVTLSSSIQAGMEFERQMLGIEAALVATGRESEVSVEKLNALAESIAEATLSGTQETRQAITILSTFGNLSVDLFEDILEAAQGISSAFGSGLTANVRLLARALEEPSRSLDSLRRVGIQFTGQQRAQIEQFERFGRTADAQNIIFERFAAFQSLARKEAEGLAGAIDTFQERILKSYEAISANVGINESLAAGFASLGDMVQTFSENIEFFAPIMDAFKAIIDGAAGLMKLMGDNINLTANAALVLFSVIAAKGATALLMLAGRLLSLNTIMATTTGVITGKIAVLTTLTTSLRTAAGAATLLRASIAPILGVTIALTAIMASQRRETEGLDYAYRSLNRTTEASQKAQGLLAQSAELVGDALIRNVRATSAILEQEYEKQLRGVEGLFKGIQDSVNQIGRGRQQGLLGFTSRDVAMTTQQIQSLEKRVEETFKTMRAGGQVSEDVLKTLSKDLKDAGIEADLNGKSFDEWTIALNNSAAAIERNESRLDALTKQMQETGTAFEASALAEIIQKDFGDAFSTLEGTMSSVGTIMIQAMLNTGDTISEVADRIIQPKAEQIEAAFQSMIDSAATEKQANALRQQLATAMSILDEETRKLVNSMGDLDGAMNRIENRDFNRYLEDITHNIRIWTASTEDARRQAEGLRDVESAYRGLADQVGFIGDEVSLTGEMISQTQAIAERLGKTVIIDPNAEDVAQQLDNALRTLAGTMVSLEQQGRKNEESFRATSREAKKKEHNIDSLLSTYQEYNDILAQNIAMQEGGSDALDAVRDLQAQEEAIRGIERAMEDMTQESFERFLSKTGMSASSVDELREKLIGLSRQSYQAEIQIQAALNVEEFFADQRSEIEQLSSQFASLMQDAMTAGDGEAFFGLAELYEKELRDMEARAKEIVVSPFSDLDTLQADFEARRELLAEMYDIDSQQYADHLEALKKHEKEAEIGMTLQRNMQNTADIMGGAMDAMRNMNRDNAREFQILAVAQAAIAQGLAIARSWSDLGPIAGPIMAGVAAASIGSQIAAMKSQSFSTGGYVSGEGGSTADRIPAMLSDGEYVINSAAVRRLGLENLEMMNQGKMPLLATGGAVGYVPTSQPGGGDVIITINDYSTGSKEYERRESITPEGKREVQIMIRDSMKQAVRNGELDSEFNSAYGISRRGKKR